MKEGRPRKGAPLLLLELLLHRLTDGHLPHGGPRGEGGLTVRLDGDTAWRGLEVVHLVHVVSVFELFVGRLDGDDVAHATLSSCASASISLIRAVPETLDTPETR